MLPRIDFTTTQAYRYLTDHFINVNVYSIKDFLHKIQNVTISFPSFLMIFYWIIQRIE